MKKLFTFIVGCVAAVSAMAQDNDVKFFIGDADYWFSDAKTTTFTSRLKDAVGVDFATSSSIIIPSISYTEGEESKTIQEFTITGLTYTQTGSAQTGDLVYTWTADEFTTTTHDIEGKDTGKQIKGNNLKASYNQAKGELTLSLNFKYDNQNRTIIYEFDGYQTIDNGWNLAGLGTKENPYRIFEAEDFANMQRNYNAETNTGKGEYFLMMNDIDFGGTKDNPVQLPAIAKDASVQIAAIKGGFDGTFDGGNHTISGIYHTKNGNDAAGKYNGLFGFTDKDAVIKNIIIGKNNYINSYNYVGAIVSVNQGTIENCENFADVTAANLDGAGICGFMVNGNGTIKDCQNYGSIASLTYASGICGGTQSGKSITEYNYLIDNCSNYGSLSTTNGIGSAGIAGNYSGAIKNCKNYGVADDTKGTGMYPKNTAGIVSCPSYPTTIENCENNGTIYGVTYVGGIVGQVMMGDNSEITIKNCTNNGAIIASGSNVAGIVGYSARESGKVSVVGCANNGKVMSTGTTELLGNIRGSETISIGTGNTIASNLDRLPLDTDDITGIADITVKADTIADGKYVKNGKLVIVKNGKAFSALGIAQ